MSSQFKIGIFGGDMRQVYMASSLISNGYSVAIYQLAKEIDTKQMLPPYKVCQSLEELTCSSRLLIGPVPVTRDGHHIYSTVPAEDLTLSQLSGLLSRSHILIGGNIPLLLIKRCDNLKIAHYDLMEDESVTILNAIATAEGTIAECIQSSPCNLHGSRCLILGYGRCAKVLAQKLKSLDASVTVSARNKDSLALASAFGLRTIPLPALKEELNHFQFIINTIPTMILDSSLLESVHSKALIIDISSAPGGVDFDYAGTLGLNAKLCLGLPGKYSPESSSDILTDSLIAYLEKEVII